MTRIPCLISLAFIIIFVTAAASAFVVVPSPQQSSQRGPQQPPPHGVRTSTTSAVSSTTTTTTATATTTAEQRVALKQELHQWSRDTQRGFQATSQQRDKVRHVLFQLAALNPTPAPAQEYYDDSNSDSDSNNSNTSNNNNSNATTASPRLRGKWNLIYTDAPDITSLQSPNPLAELGRIGQECNPPFLANVIEWKPPTLWFVPTEWRDERILQKVVTRGKSSPRTPTMVQLDIQGLKVEAAPSKKQQRSGIAALLKDRPIDWQGPLQAPFGEFELLYLDDDMRITRTGQGYFAINSRITEEEEEWF